jgi:sulfur relay protein TusB/DsrH
MHRILHILKDPESKEALRLIEQQFSLAGSEGALRPEDTALLLIQNAVKLTPSVKTKIYVLKEDAAARGANPSFEGVDYEKMVEMIFAAETVMAW